MSDNPQAKALQRLEQTLTAASEVVRREQGWADAVRRNWAQSPASAPRGAGGMERVAAPMSTSEPRS